MYIDSMALRILLDSTRRSGADQYAVGVGYGV